MNARYYVPSLGRFASADTLVPDPTNPQAFNRFSYVENNPINFNDPTGHCKNGRTSRSGSCPTPTPTATPSPTATSTPTATPSPTTTPTPTATPSPTPSANEQAMLAITVQIRLTNGTQQNVGHGVIINNNTLVTHNHWTIPVVGSSIELFDAVGNPLPVCPCTISSSSTFSVNGDVLDLRTIAFAGSPFAGLPQADVMLSANPSSLIGGDIALISYQANSSVFGRESIVEWSTVANTAHVPIGPNVFVPNSGGWNPIVSGLQVNFSVPQGASGGGAFIISGGVPRLVGVNAAHSGGVNQGYIALMR